jgi:glutathione S-transferase
MLHLIIANKLYSSWSLRPWMLMTALGIPFEETVIPMYQPDTKARMLSFGPTGKVPILVDRDVTVWESLAIIDYLADKRRVWPVWPRDTARRGHARAIASEMHAGFQALRNACPMNLRARFATPALSDAVRADIARLETIWLETRRRFGVGGPFLFGRFCAADAMYMPVVTRLDTYQLPVSADTRRYMDAMLTHPAFVKWRTEALAEPWTLPHYEQGHTPVEVFKA